MKNVELTYGYKNSRFYHVTAVENGLKCGCVCYKCGAKLIAKNNEKNIKIAHFAHYQSGQCPGGVETALHKAAIQFIVQTKTISTPNYNKTLVQSDVSGREHTAEFNFPSETLNFDVVYPERLGDGYRPDATGVCGDEMVHIEIRVTHEVDSEKAQKVRDNNEIMFEIDLRDIQPEIIMNNEKFKHEILYNLKNRKWISNPVLYNLLEEERRKLEKYVESINKELPKENKVKKDISKKEQKIDKEARIKNQQRYAEQIERNRISVKDRKEKRIEKIVNSEKRVHALFSGKGRRCISCYLVSNESDGENCPFCGEKTFEAINITSNYLKVSKHKHKSSAKIRDSIFDKPSVNLELIENMMHENED